jgi:uncharacterized protein (TIGR03032 family)
MTSTPAPAAEPRLELTGSRQFTSWLAEQRASLAFTTYQSGKLFLIGLREDGRLSVFERTFNRCMGMWASEQTLYVSTLYQLWRFENALAPGELHEGYDRLYVPRLAWTTGDIDIHDVSVDARGRPLFVSTLFSCLAAPSDTHSFEPLWKPRFISKLAAEDRCHLNGLAMKDGAPAYVTAVSESDAHEAWRDHRREGGILIDVASNEVVLRGLSMPHSPRLHGGKLWLLDSGNGHFGYADLKAGRFEPVAFCSGYARGLAFIGDFAVVGLSRPRHNKTFSGLNLDERLNEKRTEARCALEVIDLKRGDVVHSLRIEGVVEELYDVAVLPGVQRPTALGFKTDEIRRLLTVAPALK